MMYKQTQQPRQGHFGRGLFGFLSDLKTHNDRDWFAANKERYVSEVEEPTLRFIADLDGRLAKVSARFVADPRRTGGSMFRIYRDTRFSPDKSPFKTWVAARFAHEARRKVEGVPAFYLRLSPGESFGGGGVYHLDTPALTKVRQHIVAEPKRWRAVLSAGVEIEGEQLKRPPAGFDRTHEFVEDLKRKNLYTGAEFTEREVVAPDFLERYVALCEQSAPLLEFLTGALGLRW
jgi:uncharacterized protein (TIGR02453 family)